ncbi:hypothetical protein NCS56_00640400 [Fusarium sp. Ph1]|nr:hypothetical protein NCS56_00640400 [Fusarium sp. Ph1]
MELSADFLRPRYLVGKRDQETATQSSPKLLSTIKTQPYVDEILSTEIKAQRPSAAESRPTVLHVDSLIHQ